MKQTISEIDVKGKRVLMRTDFNVPMHEEKIVDDLRIRMAMPSIQSVLDRNASLTLISHLGRPEGSGFESVFSLRPVAERLSELLSQEVVLSDSDCSSKIVLKENLRFNSGEIHGDKLFAESLCIGCDIYCNDAFGTAHRNHASMVTVPQLMLDKPRVAGLLLAKELKYFNQVIGEGERPFIAILGGAKVADKIGVIKNLIGKVDTIIIGGGMAYTFLASQGISVGKSIIESDFIDEAKAMLTFAAEQKTPIMLPVDHICAAECSATAIPLFESEDIPDNLMGLDIGPQTIATYAEALASAKTVVWNGPMGVFEFEAFAEGTQEIAKILAELTASGATSVIGGGDSGAAISSFNLTDKMTHISTGGGASLQMLEGKAFLSVSLLDDTV